LSNATKETHMRPPSLIIDKFSNALSYMCLLKKFIYMHWVTQFICLKKKKISK